MKLRNPVIAVVLLVTTVLFGVPAAAAPAPSLHTALAAPTTLRIMTIGDSLNTGLGSLDGCGYRTQLNKDLVAAGVTPTFTGVLNGSGVLDCKIPYGRHGATLQDLQNNVAGWIAADDPEVVLIQIGTNDATGDVNGYQLRYQTLLTTILNAKAGIKVIGAYMPYSVTTWAVNQPSLNVQIIQATLSEQTWYPGRVALVNASKLPCKFRADGIHPDYYDPIGRWYYEGLASLYGLPLAPANSLFYQDQPMPGIHRSATSCPV